MFKPAPAVLGTFDGRRGWVNRLATRPGRRGQGHASAVLAELERRLGAKGCRKVNLLIEPDNKPVTGFYRRRGYAEDRLIFMEKWLPPGTGSGPASPDGGLRPRERRGLPPAGDDGAPGSAAAGSGEGVDPSFRPARHRDAA